MNSFLGVLLGLIFMSAFTFMAIVEIYPEKFVEKNCEFQIPKGYKLVTHNGYQMKTPKGGYLIQLKDGYISEWETGTTFEDSCKLKQLLFLYLQDNRTTAK
jgi:hypothetical protein